MKHLAETSHGLKTRSGRPHISSETFTRRQPGDKTVQWTVLSAEGHCASAMARMACIMRRKCPYYRGLSSAGRAPDLHSGGQRFDPVRLHQDIHTIIKAIRGMGLIIL